MDSKKRIFVALPISEDSQGLIFDWERRFSNLPVRWLKGKNLHITLVPPWYEEDVKGVKKRLDIFEGRGVQDVLFESVSYGPSPKTPRLIWAVGKPPQSLENLKNDLGNMFGVKPEYNSWKMHLTIARFNQKDFRGFEIKNINEKVYWSDRISSLVLMESILSREGAEYEVIHPVSLG